MRACVIDFIGRWNDHLRLIEFSYYNSYHSRTGMVPLRHYMVGGVDMQLDGSKYEIHPFWFKISIMRAIEKLRVIRYMFATAYSRHKSYVYNRKQPLEFNVGHQVYLKI